MNNKKRVFKKWWLHFILIGGQFCLGTMINYSLYHFIYYENDERCGMPMLGSLITQWVLFFIVLVPLILRMALGNGFTRNDYVLTVSMLLLNPIFNLCLFLS